MMVCGFQPMPKTLVKYSQVRLSSTNEGQKLGANQDPVEYCRMPWTCFKHLPSCIHLGVIASTYNPHKDIRT